MCAKCGEPKPAVQRLQFWSALHYLRPPSIYRSSPMPPRSELGTARCGFSTARGGSCTIVIYAEEDHNALFRRLRFRYSQARSPLACKAHALQIQQQYCCRLRCLGGRCLGGHYYPHLRHIGSVFSTLISRPGGSDRSRTVVRGGEVTQHRGPFLFTFVGTVTPDRSRICSCQTKVPENW